MPFPAVIDNTIRKEFATCPMKTKFRHVENLGTAKNVDLHFGGAFATGVETVRKWWYESGVHSVGEAISAGIAAALAAYGDFEPPVASLKTKAKLAQAIDYYFNMWPLEEETLIPVAGGIEKSFSFPLDGILHPDTGEVLRYAGKYDMLATEDGDFVVVDEKTAGRLGDSFAWQWDTDSQMSGYIYSVRREGVVDPDVNVRAKIRAVSILKTGFGHMEVNIQRSDFMLKTWYQQLRSDVLHMIDAYVGNRQWDRAMHSNACVSYGRQCEYMRLCLSPTPERYFGDYERVVWNPLEKK